MSRCWRKPGSQTRLEQLSRRKLAEAGAGADLTETAIGIGDRLAGGGDL